MNLQRIEQSQSDDSASTVCLHLLLYSSFRFCVYDDAGNKLREILISAV